MKIVSALVCACTLVLSMANYSQAAPPAVVQPHAVPFVPTAIGLASFTAAGLEGKIQVQWVTTLELELFGFHIYRGTDDNFANAARITAGLVYGQGTGGGNYSFSDANFTEGVTYYYWLMEVMLDGQTNQNGPIVIKAEPGAISTTPDTPPDQQPFNSARQMFLPQISR